MTKIELKFRDLDIATKDSPYKSRLISFKKYFDDNSLNCRKGKYIFISMPPFRGLLIFFKFNKKIILDIRDGWSIAQISGYGDIERKSLFKAKLTRLIERLLIARAYIVITCTNGLQSYLQELTHKKILLIPNGISDDNYLYARNLVLNKKTRIDIDELIFCCAGKFSEYGIQKVKKLCNVILSRYRDKKIKLVLIGSDYYKNNWLDEYLIKISNGRARSVIIPKVSRHELYKIMVKADFGLSIVRDPGYEFGTKIYDYIALNLPVVNYFDKPNNFTDYFDACLDIPFNKNAVLPEIRRSVLIKKAFGDIGAF